MPTITAAIDKLAKFSDKENIPKIIEDLQALKSPNDAADSVIEELRKGLKKFLSQQNVKKDNISLADAAYDGLLALAEFKPLNKEDLITLLEIPKEDKVFVSTGYQFSLTNLIHYHNTRNYRSNLGETDQSKWLLNLDNSKFNPTDVIHIKTIAKERGITIESLKPEAVFQQQATHTTASTARFSNNNELGEEQIQALQQLQQYGLTANHLRGWHWEIVYASDYRKALINLMTQRGVNNKTADQAVAELRGLDHPKQAFGIAKGLNKSDVLGLQKQQIKAFLALRQYGLTANHLRGWHWESVYAPHYRKALINLMTQRDANNKTAEQAVAELHELDNPQQAWGIAQGLNKSDVLGLNEEKIKAFLALRQHGLTTNHLRGWHWEIVYASHYRKALITLMTQRGSDNKTADQAVAELKSLHRWEVEKIANSGSQPAVSSINIANHDSDSVSALQPDNLIWRFISDERSAPLGIENQPRANNSSNVTQTILPSSFSTVINEITGFFQRLFNSSSGSTNTQTQTPQEDRPVRFVVIEDFEARNDFSYRSVFSSPLSAPTSVHPSPLSPPTSSASNTRNEEPTSTLKYS